MFSEDDILPLSALQHFLFCPRRAALVHIEAIWDENRATAEGYLFHERVHKADGESRGDVRVARGLRLRSLRLGLTGVADVVEFHRLPEAMQSETTVGALRSGMVLEGIKGFWCPLPIEYKVGKLRRERGYEVQLCAQALCLEEMLDVAVPHGALFYGKTVRRLEVSFDDSLRAETEDAARRLHEIVRSGKTPRVRYQKKCPECSLVSVCMPKITGVRRDVGSYLRAALKETGGETE
jgi:CRISPR-associated exonuclease Cas4